MSKPLRVAINGYGRIGRCVLRAWAEAGLHKEISVVAINEPADSESMLYLTKYDSTHGVFPADVELQDNKIIIGQQKIALSHAHAPEQGPWQDLQPDILLECSGHFNTRAQLSQFLDYGCHSVLVSHPASSAIDVDHTVVYGINENRLKASDRIVSAASCTTNASVPVLDLLDRNLGIESAFLSTLHSVMNDQPMIDGYHNTDLRRTRSAMQSIIPVATGLAQGIERLLPNLAGRIQAKAIRVPILNVSAIDLAVNLARPCSVESLNQLFIQASLDNPAVFACTAQPHASVDFNHRSHSVVVDLSQTRVNQGRFANLLLWFDNEWGFANRMLDVTLAWSKLL